MYFGPSNPGEVGENMKRKQKKERYMTKAGKAAYNSNQRNYKDLFLIMQREGQKKFFSVQRAGGQGNVN